MKTTNTAANTTAAANTKAGTTAPATKPARKAIAVDASGIRWGFTPTSVTLDKHEFPCSYSVNSKRDVYAFVSMDTQAVRLHFAASSPVHGAAFEAAMAAKAAKQPAKQADAKPAPAAKQPAADEHVAKHVAKVAEQPAKQAEYVAKHAAKAAPAAKQPAKVAKQPAKQAEAKPAPAAKQPVPADGSWIGTAITGNGWRIAFDEATQRTRVSFDAQPSAKQKAAVEAAGFYFSAPLKSWNKKLTHKAYRAAQTLAATLTALA